MRTMDGRLGLTGGQMVSCLVQGAVLWLGFALLLRWLGPMGIYEGGLKAAIYLLAVPLSVPLVLQIEKLAKLRRDQVFAGMAVGTMAAILLDGLALGFFPRLYGETVEMWAGAGALILWGGGVGLLLGWWRTKRV
jgi:hypothetical protein